MILGTGSPLLPDHLPAIGDRWNIWLRPAWFAVLALTIILDLSGTVFALREVSRYDVAFARIGLNSQYEDDGSVTVASLATPGGGATDVPEGSRIVAIDGRGVPRDAKIWTIAARLERVEGEAVRVAFATPDRRRFAETIRISSAYARTAEAGMVLKRATRIALRLAISLSTCAVLIVCAMLLYLRRSRDPVAVLLSMSFLVFAGSIDPPLMMWIALGTGSLYDIYVTAGWVLLVIGLAAFPDGEFRPRPVRWTIVAAPVLAVPLMIDSIPMPILSTIAFVAPLGLVLSHLTKFRRYPEGIERQQIKWAAFGFASGLAVLAVTFYLTAILPSGSRWMPIYGLGILVLFNTGFLLMACGLFVSLIRFRLWEADRVINRSTAAAAVTLVVGVVWTLTSDLVKTAVQYTIGDGHEVVATTAGALLAAGLFAPTQTLALRWTKRRFDKDRDRMRRLTTRLRAWGTAETPEEIALRTLSSLAAIIHSSCSAILVDMPHARVVLAARDIGDEARLEGLNVAGRSDPQFVRTVALEDEDGPLGLLLLGPRSDLNRYNAEELGYLDKLSAPLAEALRISMKRFQQTDRLHRALNEVQERLARLESDPRQPPPAMA